MSNTESTPSCFLCHFGAKMDFRLVVIAGSIPPRLNHAVLCFARCNRDGLPDVIEETECETGDCLSFRKSPSEMMVMSR